MCPFVETRTNFPHADYNECEFKVIGRVVVSIFFHRRKALLIVNPLGKGIHLNIAKLFLTNQSKEQFVECNVILLSGSVDFTPTDLSCFKKSMFLNNN